MPAILQVVNGHGGALVVDLDQLTGGTGGMVQRGIDLAESQLASTVSSDVQWSPTAGPTPLGRRRISVPFILRGTSADDLGARVATLQQAIRGPWWLRVRRHQGSQDSWLRCFGGVPQFGSDRVTSTSNPNIAIGSITCDTDPYALGARVDGGPIAVDMDPAHASGWAVDIDGVGGDTATPLLLRMQDSTAFAAPMMAFVGVRRRQTPGNVVSSAIVRQGEAGTNLLVNGPGIKLTIPTDPDFDLSGSYCLRATFSSSYNAGDSATITFAAPDLSGPDAPGTYRMLLRIRRSGGAEAQQLIVQPYTNNSQLSPEAITIPANGSTTRIVDLGLTQWPSAQPAMLAAPLPTVSSGSSSTGVTVEFWRKSPGAGVVDFDYLGWVPADEDAGYLELDGPLFRPTTQSINVDGYQHLAAISSSDVTDGVYDLVGQAYGSATPTARWTGRVPRVSPGANRLFVVAGLSSVTAWPLHQSLSVAWSYWPRYTWLR